MFQSWENHRRTNLFEQFWAPLSSSSNPSLFILERTLFIAYQAIIWKTIENNTIYKMQAWISLLIFNPSQSISQGDLVPTNKLIGFGRCGGCRAGSHRRCRVSSQNYDLRYGDDIATTDLQSSPAILIGGFSNTWTMQITHRLRYTLEEGHKIVDNNDKSKVLAMEGRRGKLAAG